MMAMMIEVIDETNDDDDDDADNAADALLEEESSTAIINAVIKSTKEDARIELALTVLVKHDSDPVHTSTFTATDGTTIPAVVAHWVDQLSSSTTSSSSSSSAVLLIQLLQGYATHIRPVLLQRGLSNNSIRVVPTGIPVLSHYQILVKQLLLLSPQPASTDMDISLDFLQAMTSDITSLTKLCVTLHAQEREEEEKDDDTATTANKMKQEISCDNISQSVLPLLIQLITLALELPLPLHIPSTTIILHKCIVALLAFGYPRMDPRDVVGKSKLESLLMILQQDSSFLYAPIMYALPSSSSSSQMPPPSSSSSDKFINLGFHWNEQNFWETLKLDGRPWESTAPTLSLVFVEKFWRVLHRRLHHSPASTTAGSDVDHAIVMEPESETDDTSKQQSTPTSTPTPPVLQDVIQDCLATITGDHPQEFAKAVRAHFFGRDMVPLQEDLIIIRNNNVNRNKKTRLMLGREVPVSSQEEKEPYHLQPTTTQPFLEIPSRVHAAMHYILLQQQQLPSTAVLDELMPIIYELLSATSACHVGMGAAALIHLLLLPSSAPTPPQQSSLALTALITTTTTTNQEPSSSIWFDKYTGSLLPVLDLACQTCREGPSFAMLARAQSLVCEMASSSSVQSPASSFSSIMVKHRRKTTRNFLSLLDKYRHKVTDPDGLLWALLVGGIIPLLHQHATLPECTQSVDGLEMGRLGLQALLPIVRYSAGYRLEMTMTNNNDDNHDKLNATRKLLGPSVIALAHVLLAAHPIMARHGGKVMSEILALLGNLTRQPIITNQDRLLQSLVLSVAGMALVICGQRAEQILDDVVTTTATGETECFEPEFVALVHQVRKQAESWKRAQQASHHDLSGSNHELL